MLIQLSLLKLAPIDWVSDWDGTSTNLKTKKRSPIQEQIEGNERWLTSIPTISQEWRRGWHPEIIPQAPKRENTLIIGSGPSGLECALTLARAGHEVTVAERASEFGGRVLKESRLKGLSAWGRVKDYRLYQLPPTDRCWTVLPKVFC